MIDRFILKTITILVLILGEYMQVHLEQELVTKEEEALMLLEVQELT